MATTKFNAILHAKCPRCRRGDLFATSMYGFKVQHMHEHCPHCGLRYEIEPGYFYAAMYVSYALNVAEMVTLGVATYVLSGKIDFDNFWLYIATVIGGSIVLAPFNYRYSRVLLLHLLSPKVHYNAAYDTE
ncbi:DUF983 domain-containing protein [Pedobacter sp. HMF7647]|uniref:DUF983 domain-containing protein n=1 Tax=Hufsiella arboris TaxID=2695275 RepID=A0A7K1Y5J8_9SPHI|nr:DUF983 domain-containing protein [Hufsiella arboris]MXV49389.1 DUF983 domain-containing protein [Hufsiella arboris]